MRVFSYFLFLVGVGLLLPIASAGEFKVEPGFKLIFNRKNLAGRPPHGKNAARYGKSDIGRFKVVDGGIVRFDSSKKGESYIETAKELPGDVTVKFDFKPGPKCNNDFFLRGIKFDIVPGNKECKNVKEGRSEE